MNGIQILTILLSTVPTMLVVLVGIPINNSRLGDPEFAVRGREYQAERDPRAHWEIESRLTNIEAKFDTRFDMLPSNVVDVDNRLTRIEAQGH